MEKIPAPKPLVQPVLAEEIKFTDKTFIAPRSVATVALPSRGYFYSNPSVKNGSVEITPLTARDMKLVAGITGDNIDGVIDTLLKRCLVTSIDPAELLTTDRYFLLIMLRANSFGSGVNITVRCPNAKCSRVNNLVLDLIQDYDLINVKEGASEPFEFELPSSKYKVTYHLPRGKDVKRIEALTAAVKASTSEAEIGDNALTVSVASLIDTVNGAAVPEEHRMAIVDSFSAKDFILLKRDMDSNTPGITSQTTKICAFCKGEIEVGSPLHSAEFFYPLS